MLRDVVLIGLSDVDSSATGGVAGLPNPGRVVRLGDAEIAGTPDDVCEARVRRRDAATGRTPAIGGDASVHTWLVGYIAERVCGGTPAVSKWKEGVAAGQPA